MRSYFIGLISNDICNVVINMEKNFAERNMDKIYFAFIIECLELYSQLVNESDLFMFNLLKSMQKFFNILFTSV